MRYLISCLLFFSLSAHAAVLTSHVVMSPSNVPTVHYFSTPTTQSSGDLYAQGMRWFGIGTQVVSMINGDPLPPGFGEKWSNMLPGQAIPVMPGDTWVTVSKRYIDSRGASGALTGPAPMANTYKYEACALASPCEDCGTSLAIDYPASCSAVPWTTNSCDILQPSLLINHGTLTTDQVNGHSASTTTQVRCDSPATVRFRVSDTRVDLGNNIYSDIYINGRGVGGAWGDMDYTVQSWGLPLTIESRLVSTDPQAGTFSGSVVVLVDIQ